MNINSINLGKKPFTKVMPESTEKTNKTARDAYNFPHGMTVDQVRGKNPNIVKLTPEQIFDIQYVSATKLSDGSTLVRPVILSMGEVDIKPSETEKGKYIFSRTPQDGYYGEPITKEMTEEELLNNKSLCRGKLKKDGNKYVLSFTDLNGKNRIFMTDKAGCIRALKDNLLYI